MHTVRLSKGHDVDEWRNAARLCVQAGLPPSAVHWVEGDNGGDVFGALVPPPRADNAPPVRASRAFLRLAESVLLHTDPTRHAILYDILWRLQTKPSLIDDGSDPMIRRANLLAKAVGRDIHKMRAFVRFREVRDDDGTPHFIAWFEPQFAILRANAPFFIGRFATMRWTILTPQGSLHWDGASLIEGPAAARSDAPKEDDGEALWQTYYAAIFNPARLKIGAMVKEMPRRYWKNLPEAALIPDLIAGAQAREAKMVARGDDPFDDCPEPQDLSAIAQGIEHCRRCPIGCNGTRAVMGEGSNPARVMVIGEAPGDTEERVGRPFVGPAGAILRHHLAAAGLPTDALYITSAVKHFKFEQRETPQGKMRLHKTPSADEIDRCRWWLEREIGLVNPSLIIALGASAGRALTGRTPNVKAERGQFRRLANGRTMALTYHPSYVLHIDDRARTEVEQAFSDDLLSARQWLCDVEGIDWAQKKAANDATC